MRRIIMRCIMSVLVFVGFSRKIDVFAYSTAQTAFLRLSSTSSSSSIKRRRTNRESCKTFLTNYYYCDSIYRIRCNTKRHHYQERIPTFLQLSSIASAVAEQQNPHQKRLRSSSTTTTIAEVVVLLDHHHYNEILYDGANTGGSVSTDTTKTAQKHDTTAAKLSSIQLHPKTYQMIQTLVQQRAGARYEGNYTLADHYKSLIDQIPIEFRYTTAIRSNQSETLGIPSTLDTNSNNQINFVATNDTTAIATSTLTATTDLNHYPVILPISSPSSQPPTTMHPSLSFRIAITDISRKQGGGSTWSIICGIPITIDHANGKNISHNGTVDFYDVDGDIDCNTVLSHAHRALGIAVSLSSSQRRRDSASKCTTGSNDLTRTIHKAKEQLRNWYLIHQQLYYNNNNKYDSGNYEEIVRKDVVDAARTATMTLDQLRTLIAPTTQIPHVESSNNNNNSVQLYHWYCVETRLSGRTAADAAFWFAMAGVVDEELYNLLIMVCEKELLRFGIRSSRRYKDIIDIVERLAAAGVRNVPRLESIIDQCLNNKVLGKKDIKVDPPYLHLHSNHCSLLIWHFSTRQRKQRSFLQTAANHYDCDSNQGIDKKAEDANFAYTTSLNEINLVTENPCNDVSSNTIKWDTLFDDPTRPLVVDIGCGMGISLLGLASIEENYKCSSIPNNNTVSFPYHACNFIGVDLSSLSIHYASGIAQRWNISNRLAFVVDEAEHFLDRIMTSKYPGPIKRILIQFPTPYRLSSLFDIEDTNDEDDIAEDTEIDDNKTTWKEDRSGRGNTQLPASIRSGFMVTSELLQKAGQLLRQQQDKDRESQSLLSNMVPDMILQSNCEDVAVLMRNLAIKEAGFVIHNELFEYNIELASKQIDRSNNYHLLQPTQRTMNWIRAYNETNGIGRGMIERAQGYGWWHQPILPPTGRTETEIACILNGTPIHRCIVKIG